MCGPTMAARLLELPSDLLSRCIAALPHRWPDEAAVRCTCKALVAAAPEQLGEVWMGAIVATFPSTVSACTSLLERELCLIRRRTPAELLAFAQEHMDIYDDVDDLEEGERFMRTDELQWVLNNTPLPPPTVSGRVTVCFRDARRWIASWIDRPSISKFEQITFDANDSFRFAGSEFAASLRVSTLGATSHGRPVLCCALFSTDSDASTGAVTPDGVLLPCFEPLHGDCPEDLCTLKVHAKLPHLIRYRCCFLGPSGSVYTGSSLYPKRTELGGSTVSKGHGGYCMEVLSPSVQAELLDEMRIAGTRHLRVEIVLEHLAYGAMLY